VDDVLFYTVLIALVVGLGAALTVPFPARTIE
jgi:hypothetical protein